MDYREFTNQAHGDQKYGEKPYSVHLEAVQAKVAQYTSDEAVIRAAYMHDAIEDTNLSFEDIKAHEGEEVARLVDLVTDRPGKNRKERHLNTYWRIRTDPNAVLIKLADRFSNHQNVLDTNNVGLIRMYAKEYDMFKFELFDATVHQELWAELDTQVEVMNARLG